MLASAFASTLIGAPVAIGVAATDDWLVASLVADAVERTIDSTTRFDAIRLPNDERCKEQSDRCVGQARIDFNVDDVLLIRVFSGVTKHLVIIEAFSHDLFDPKKVTVSLVTDGRGWEEQLATVVAELLPAKTESLRTPVPAVEPPIAEPAGLWGPALIIASAVVVATAAVLGDQTGRAREKLLEGVPDPGEFERVNDKRRAYMISSLVLYGLGAVFAGGGVVFVLLEW